MNDKKPNILLLFTDDQRFDTLAAWGNEQIHTPNLDRLVGRGCSLRNAYIMGGSSGAVCMPSRAMLHTGRTLYHLDRQGQTIPESHTLLGEHLQQCGYTTWGCGKWHNSPASYARSFCDGAEIYFGGMNDHWNVPACDFDPTGRYPEARHTHARWGQRFVEGNFIWDHFATGTHSTDLFADAASRFLEGYSQNKPWFAYVSFMAPHDPREMPAKYLQLYEPDEIELPPNWLPKHPFDNECLYIRDEELAPHPRTEADTRKQIAEYYAMISHLDDAIGRILEAVERRGELDNTIVVFAGDNGLAVGQHGLFGKQSNYEHSIHVPLLMAGPGVPDGVERDGFCYLLDIFPTLCELIGADIPSTVEGKSLLPHMRGDAPSHRDHLLFAYTRLMRSVRDGKWKLIETAANGRQFTQLFDLEADPWETRNLADEPSAATTLRSLRAKLGAWRTTLDDDHEGQGADFWAARPDLQS